MQVEDIASGVDWQGFETLVADIFRAHDFKVKQNFRFKTSSRHEIDVIAVDGRFMICVDCKHWSGGRSKVYGLKSAVKDQQKRVRELQRFLKKNVVAREMLGTDSKEMLPMVVTLMEEEMVNESGVWVVPVSKFNSFLAEKENYLT